MAPVTSSFHHGQWTCAAAWRVECGWHLSARGSSFINQNKQVQGSTLPLDFRVPLSDSYPCLSGGFFRSHSLVFTFSSETSQDLAVIPFVPLLPGDREWKQQSLSPTQPSPSCGTSASCCSFWESSEKLLVLLLVSAVFAISTPS